MMFMYCHRFFRPLPKGRLCYNNNLIENRNSVGDLTLAKNNFQNRSVNFLENAVTLFEPTNKQSKEAIERIAQLEQLVSLLTLALDMKKDST